MTDTAAETTPAGRLRRRTARLGVAGFLFFLLKGLRWLIIPVLVARGFINQGENQMHPALENGTNQTTPFAIIGPPRRADADIGQSALWNHRAAGSGRREQNWRPRS